MCSSDLIIVTNSAEDRKERHGNLFHEAGRPVDHSEWAGKENEQSNEGAGRLISRAMGDD